MAPYQCMQASAQVRGEFVIPMIDSAGPFQDIPLKILADNGINEPQPGEWYSYQAYLNSLKAIAAKMGPATMFLIGKWMVEDSKWPADMDSMDRLFEALDQTYRAYHRGESNSYKTAKVDEKNIRVTSQSPYPEDVERGLIETLVRKYKPKNVLTARVKVDPSQPSKSKGSNSSSYLVSW